MILQWIPIGTHNNLRTESQKVDSINWLDFGISRSKGRTYYFLNYFIEISRGCYSIVINEQFIFKFINNY